MFIHGQVSRTSERPFLRPGLGERIEQVNWEYQVRLGRDPQKYAK